MLFFLLGFYAQANSHFMDNIHVHFVVAIFVLADRSVYGVVWYLHVCPYAIEAAYSSTTRTRRNRQTLIDEIPLKLAIYNEMLRGKGNTKNI